MQTTNTALREAFDEGSCTPLATIERVSALIRNGGDTISVPRTWLRWLLDDARTLQSILAEEGEKAA